MRQILTKFIYLYILFIGINSTTLAQMYLPDQLISKYDDGVMYLRWEPLSLENWQNNRNVGYTVKVTDVTTSVLKDIEIKNIVKPMPYAIWDETMAKQSPFKQQFYQGCMNILYPEYIVDEEQKIENAFPQQDSEMLDSFKLGLLLYAATYDFDLAEKTGLAYQFTAKQGHTYHVVIEAPGVGKIEKDFDAVYETTEIPELHGKWGDKEVELSWNSLPYTKSFFGYMLEVSRDGINFKMKDSIPYVNNLEKYTKPGDTASIQIHKDSLEKNYETYYFRLRGFDYFGQTSNKYSGIVGHGFDKMTMSPLLIFADQTEDNEAHLKWQVPEQESHLVKDFTIMRADSSKGKYSIALDSVSAYAREIKFPMKHTINYFRIVANGEGDQELSSMPVLVMGQDTIPPAKPDLIRAYIDSVGNVEVKWMANTEDDLWGYRIFKSNFGSDEFSLLNAYPVLDTVFIDSVSLHLGTENIFYIVQAADKRNNRSPYSDTVKLEIPDVVPPASPMVSKVEQVEDSVKIHFVRSMSTDAVSHMIYRRDIKQEDGWYKIYEFDSTFTKSFVLDGNVLAGHEYAYTMVARDEVGLESQPEFYKEIYVKGVEKEFIPFEEINQELNSENNTVTIKWVTNTDKVLKSVMVYKGVDKNRLSKYKYVDYPETSITENLNKDGTALYYRLKPIFEEQEKAYFSDFITVQVPNDENGKDE